jgi:hypothetical protein
LAGTYRPARARLCHGEDQGPINLTREEDSRLSCFLSRNNFLKKKGETINY